MRLIRRPSPRQLGDIVMPIPFRQLVQPGVHGVILLDTGRVDKAVHVLVPTLDALFDGLQRHVVAHLFGERLKRLILSVFIAVFSHASHQILAHVEVGIQEYLSPHRLNQVIRYALQRTDLVLFAIIRLQSHVIDG